MISNYIACACLLIINTFSNGIYVCRLTCLGDMHQQFDSLSISDFHDFHNCLVPELLCSQTADGPETEIHCEVSEQVRHKPSCTSTEDG